MRIIKKGKPRSTDGELKFECPDCGCVFVAHKNEYSLIDIAYPSFEDCFRAKCKCPNCNSSVWGRSIFLDKECRHDLGIVLTAK